MKRYLSIRMTVAMFFVATLINTGPLLIAPVHGYGTLTFASGFRDVHIGMTWDEWKRVQREHGVECICDATDCLVEDIFHRYEVTFRSTSNEPLRLYYKHSWLKLPLDRRYLP